ncbi:RNA polymerase sigma factor [Actinoplanes sp. NEAU-A12]|uniref:RNA polymerase sigma factor n=1 Tax=Actinoplanes sandaracinus TaxID=3045177 RepID=A0ABT6WI72_9ACTN|nr:RNA polymerase sigma factor [Actinoplanes sandaracinus]MDI6099434.1 RNA polymerase sigma factor [Actinoplanes sandaracinus]
MSDERAAAFETLYTGMFHHLLGYATRRCDTPEDAADVVAEIFAVAWRHLDRIPPGEQARLWLYGVARNVLANQRRGATRQRLLPKVLASEVATLYEPSAEDSADLGTVAAIFRGLPDSDRELLSLVAWEGLDPGQIATVLGCSRNAVRIRLHRARRRLAKELASAGIVSDLHSLSGGGVR